MMKNMVAALFLTERDASLDDNAPKIPGRITTTLPKAKEIRGLVERCITIAKKVQPAIEESKKYGTDAKRGSDEYREWRKSEKWAKWAEARAPVVTAQRRIVQLIGDRHATDILFNTIAPRFVDRPGGYTRILKLAKPRLGDAGDRAVLELVGKNDRVKKKSASKPAFESEPEAAGGQSDESESKPETETASA